MGVPDEGRTSRFIADSEVSKKIFPGPAILGRPTGGSRTPTGTTYRRPRAQLASGLKLESETPAVAPAARTV